MVFTNLCFLYHKDMRIEPISLTHRSLLQQRFNALGLDISEYNFANIFLFRHIHNPEIIFGKEIYIKGKTRDGYSFLMPTTTMENVDRDELHNCLKKFDFLYPIPQEWAKYFDSKEYEISHLEQDSDYNYRTEKFRHYPGRHLSGRRNLVKQFKELYPEHQTFDISASNASDALQVLDEWQAHSQEDPRFTDYESCFEALKLTEALGLSGRISYISGKPVGFVIGEPLNNHTYLMHFAKGVTEYKGIYQFIYQEFAQKIEDKFVFINMEQDLGSEDLQRAKQSYMPDSYSIKLRVKLIG